MRARVMTCCRCACVVVVLPAAQGPILAFIFAVRELMNGCGSSTCGQGGSEGGAGTPGLPGGLPVNVAFVFEGEEENGSRGFRQAIMQNLRCVCVPTCAAKRHTYRLLI